MAYALNKAQFTNFFLLNLKGKIDRKNEALIFEKKIVCVIRDLKEKRCSTSF